MHSFPIKNYYDLHFKTTPQNQLFPTVPHTYFSTKFRTTFNFIEVFTDDKPYTCATLIQNSTNHIATLPTGHIGYIEVPITNEKPKFFHVNDIITLINKVTHTNHSEITEIIPQTNYPSQYKDDESLSINFHYTKNTSQILIYHQKLLLYTMYNPLHILQNLAFLLHCRTQQKISNLSTISTFDSQTLPIPSILHFVTYYSNTKHVMQLIKMMVAKLKLAFESD